MFLVSFFVVVSFDRIRGETSLCNVCLSVCLYCMCVALLLFQAADSLALWFLLTRSESKPLLSSSVSRHDEAITYTHTLSVSLFPEERERAERTRDVSQSMCRESRETGVSLWPSTLCLCLCLCLWLLQLRREDERTGKAPRQTSERHVVDNKCDDDEPPPSTLLLFLSSQHKSCTIAAAALTDVDELPD